MTKVATFFSRKNKKFHWLENPSRPWSKDLQKHTPNNLFLNSDFSIQLSVLNDRVGDWEGRKINQTPKKQEKIWLEVHTW